MEESHLHRQITPSSDINFIVEFQRPNPDEGEEANYVYAWTGLDLFAASDYSLRTGFFKIPFYKPPTDLDIRRMDLKERLPDFYICMRVAHGKNDPISEQKCEPKDKHKYLIPELH